MKENQWMYNSNEEVWTNCDYFDTKEEAIEVGKKEFENDSFYVGQINNSNIGVGVDADRILDDIAENVRGEVGGVADDYLSYVNKEHLSELEDLLNDVLHQWMDKHDYRPKYFRVDNVDCITTDDVRHQS